MKKIISKFNWGWGIAIFYSLFVLVMIAAVVKASRHKPDMVNDNYYALDIHYQAHYDKIKNQQNLKKELLIVQSEQSDSLIFYFPEQQKNISGTVHFFRPSNRLEDKKLSIQLNERHQFVVPIDQFNPGLWRLKTEWQSAGAFYFKEQSIVL